MKKPSIVRQAIAFVMSGRTAQVIWLLFALSAVSLALSGISALRQILRNPCAGAACIPGQLTLEDTLAALAAGSHLTPYINIVFLVYLVSAAFLLLLAVSLIWRKPNHPAAVSGAFLLVAMGTSFLAQLAARNIPALFLPAECVQIVQLSLLVPFFGHLPDGRFRPDWLGWAALGIVPAAVLFVINGGPQVLGVALSLVICIAIVAGAVSHSRTSTSPEEKEQVAWVIAAILLLAVVQMTGLPIRLLPLPVIHFSYGLPGLLWFYPVFGMLLLIAAVTCLAVALLHDELFRVDVALNRTIVYAFLTLFVVGSYVLIVGYLSLVFQSSGSLWLSLIATGVVAMLFQPIRRQVQRFVNRIIYGERDDPYTVLAQVGQRLETAISSDDVIPMIIQTVQEALKAPYVAIDLRLPEDESFEVAGECGQRSEASLILLLSYHNEPVGRLRVSTPEGKNGLSTRDRRLLDDLARQAGAAIFAARQNADLKIARERLVLAQGEERRRIRRDLHDGLGAALAALNMQAGEVQRLMSTDPENANRRIVELRIGLREAIGDIRRLVYGLRPPALDELGLLGALRSRIDSYESGQPNKPDGLIEDNSRLLVLCLEAPEQLPSLPAAVEVAIYRIVEEGLANIVHHGEAKNGLVTISIEHQGLRIEVSDDGVGMAQDYRPGIGLHSMRERTVELGGRWSIQSTAGQGTCIMAWLPLTASNIEELHGQNHHPYR
jgi:signal transduction histidine kinase